MGKGQQVLLGEDKGTGMGLGNWSEREVWKQSWGLGMTSLFYQWRVWSCAIAVSSVRRGSCFLSGCVTFISFCEERWCVRVLLSLKESTLPPIPVKCPPAGFGPNPANVKCFIITCVVGFLLAPKSFRLILYLQLQGYFWSHSEHVAFKRDHIFFEVAVSNVD